MGTALAQGVIAIAICIAIVTRIVSSVAFARNVKSTRIGRAPPTAPYWIPGAYHLFEILGGPAALIGRLIKKHGPSSPFYIRIGNASMLIVSDPAHVKSMFLASKHVTPKGFHMILYEQILGLPKEAVELYKQDPKSSPDTQTVHAARFTLVRRYLSGENILELTQVYIAALRKNLLRTGVQSDTWLEIEDLWTFFRTVLPQSLIEVILGSSILEQYPDLVDQFWAFDDNIQAFPEAPLRPILAAAVHPNAARDRILTTLKDWLSRGDLADPQTDALVEAPFWNADTGSKLFRHRDSLFASLPVSGFDGRASETLGILEGGMANTMPSTFWYLFEALRNPELRQRLHSEVIASRTPSSSGWDLQDLGSRPLLLSMQSEITRLRMASAVIRMVESDDFLLHNTYSVPKGTLIFAFSKDAGSNTAAWSKARPLTTTKPLTEFWADRFLESSNSASKSTAVEDAKEIRCNTDGLNGLYFTFGGGQHLCPGKAWAKNIQIATLAVLFDEYEIELRGNTAIDRTTPVQPEKVIGTSRPKTKIPVRIRVRRQAK